MWHRISDGQIVESVDHFGDDWMNDLTPGELQERFGWVRGTGMLKPDFNPLKEQLHGHSVLDPRSLTVTEYWTILPYPRPELAPVFDYEAAGVAREQRIARRLAKTDPVAALLRKVKL